MKALMRNPRTAAPTLAVLVTLVLTFAVPPFNSVVAAGSSSSMSSSSAPACDSHFRVSTGAVTPPAVVSGDLFLEPPCRFVGTVTIKLNDAILRKSPASDGTVPVTVQIPVNLKGTLDDPVDVTIHLGTNTMTVTGPTNFDTTGTVTADFDVNAPPVTPVNTTPIPVTPTPVATTQTTGGTGAGNLARTGLNLMAIFLLALMAIALGTYTMASERAIPLAVAAGPEAVAISVPLWDPPLGGPERWSLESLVLAGVSMILGPPPGRHSKKDRRGLLPAIRDRL